MAMMGQVSSNSTSPSTTWAEYKAWLEGYLHGQIGELTQYQLSNIRNKINTVRANDYAEQEVSYKQSYREGTI